MQRLDLKADASGVPSSPDPVCPSPPRPSHAAAASPAQDAPVGRHAPVQLLVGSSSALASTRRQLVRVAPYRQPVLVYGESGTGKEIAAGHLHGHSGRAGPLVAINCGAISGPLVHSQLFGHARGAFTGAVAQRRGAFARAHRGTLFLDEVAELPLPMQAVLLRVLETSAFTPVGSESEVAVDVRLVCATHRDLEHMVSAGEFREDLFHRLNVLTIRMPPLRDRPDDVAILMQHFARQLERDMGHRLSFTAEAVAGARKHPWPGNVRQLRNAVARAAILCAGGPIDAADLLPGRAPASAGELSIPRGDYRFMRRAMLQRIVAEVGSVRQASAVLRVPRSTLGNWLRES